MGISITVDLGRINKKFGPNAKKVAEYAIANQAMLDMERFVPLRGGDLRGSGHVSGNQIAYNTVYARAQFYGSSYNKHRSFTFSKYTTPGTGPRWDLKAKGMYGDKWADKGREALGL
nr:MAG TPA: Minor capsid protein [Caudoviricetes sp.]